MPSPKVDFQIVSYGTILLLYPKTHRARRWIKENLPQDHLRCGEAWVVDDVCISDIIDVVRGEDLEIIMCRGQLSS